MPFGQSLTGSVEHQGNMRIVRRRECEEFTDEQLSRRCIEQIIATNNLSDALPMIINHHRKVVGRHAVSATHNEIVDRPFVCPDNGVNEPEAAALTTYP